MINPQETIQQIKRDTVILHTIQKVYCTTIGSQRAINDIIDNLLSIASDLESGHLIPAEEGIMQETTPENLHRAFIKVIVPHKLSPLQNLQKQAPLCQAN